MILGLQTVQRVVFVDRCLSEIFPRENEKEKINKNTRNAYIGATIITKQCERCVQKPCTSYMNATCGHVSAMTHFHVYNLLLETKTRACEKLIERRAVNSFLMAYRWRKGETDTGRAG